MSEAIPVSLPRLAIHVCYHKCMTVYFERVMKQVANHLQLAYQYVDRGAVLHDEVHLAMYPHGEIDLDALPDFHGTHLIRDPRDLLVSGYLYHLRTDEEWCAKPNPNHTSLPADVSYQQYLQDMDQEDGLLFEMNHVSGYVISQIVDWDYHNPRFLELRFEQVMDNEAEVFGQVFEWYGLHGQALEEAVEIALSRSLTQLPKDDSDAAHARQGSYIGHWRDYFTPTIKQQFKQKFGSALISLGYEQNQDW
ncbi:MAG: hypothetical protein Tsb002_33030 [Wenzhouxiangellaceae bacterium]